MNIAIIMDGNGRWAKRVGKDRIKGHQEGVKVARNITNYCAKDELIHELTLYAFSTENWKRPKKEVDFLISLLKKYLKSELKVYLENDIRFKAIGDISKFNKDLVKLIRDLEYKTSHCKSLLHNLALNYGAKNEIVRACRKIVSNADEINEDNIAKNLDSVNSIDIMIRTGEQRRLSNFMLWQISYAELFFTDTMWPDFSTSDLEDIIKMYSKTHRRFGGL